MRLDATGKNSLIKNKPLFFPTEEDKRLIDFFALLLEWDIADKKVQHSRGKNAS